MSMKLLNEYFNKMNNFNNTYFMSLFTKVISIPLTNSIGSMVLILSIGRSMKEIKIQQFQVKIIFKMSLSKRTYNLKQNMNIKVEIL